MMKAIFRGVLFLVSMILVCLSTTANAQLSKFWTSTAYGAGADNISEDISADGAGNCYVTGTFNGVTQFYLTTLSSAGVDDIFIAKYNSVGGLMWAKRAGSSNGDWASSICTDVAGNSYITGYTADQADFGSIHLTLGSSETFYIAKYNSNGDCIWVKTAGGLGAGHGVCLDDQGNLYVAGEIEGTVTFGTFSITSSGSADIFVAKYDTSGTCLWVRRAGSAGLDWGNAIAYSSGHLYLTGTFTGSMSIGSTALTSAGLLDAFIARYDVYGNATWAKSGGGMLDDRGKAIAVDNAGNCSVTGSYKQSATFDGHTLPGSGADQFTVHYDSSGNYLSGGHIATTDGGRDIIVNAAGTKTYATFEDQMNPGSITLDGWANALCFDNVGNVMVTGTYYNSSTSNYYIYVTKLADKTAAVNSVVNSPKAKLYPNPAIGKLDIQFETPETGQLLLYNSLGQIALQQKIFKQLCTHLNIMGIDPGFYLIVLETNRGQFTLGGVNKL